MVDVAVGIDVGGARKGFHAVALRDGAYAAQLASREVQELAHWCRSVVQARVIATAGGEWVRYGEQETGWIVVPRGLPEEVSGRA